MYRVVWELKNGRHGGNGSPLDTKEEALGAAARMNAKYPMKHHWVEPVTDEPEIPKAPTR